MVAATVFAILVSKSDSKSVFSAGRDLPIYSVDYPEKKVAITFDCAWGADDIPYILDTLEKENIKATFFIVGQWAVKYPEAVKMISVKGHDIGNHSFSHLRMGGIGESKIREEISLGNRRLEEISGNKVDLFRAPYGDYNNRVVEIARQLGNYTIQWDVEGVDIKVKTSEL
jgi:peptidoglycan/xylan/chitin deacetylase (PgdA/CDA1 family)